nr:hypothetical protein [Tanacetum cinerariifolium]GEW16269.1 hypothetical protein [Tanacetum cinerariifolium]
MKDIAIKELGKKLKVAVKEKNRIQLTVDKLENASKGLNKLIECQIVDNCKKELGYESYNAVLPSYTRNFMPPKPDFSYTSLDEFAIKPVAENKSSEEETKEKPKTKVIDHVFNHNSASITLKKFDYVDPQGRSKRDLHLVDEEGVDCLPNSTVFENLELMRKHKRKDSQVPQLSVPTKCVADEAIYKELDDRLVRASTNASSLEAKCQESIWGTISQTSFENVSNLPNDSLLIRGDKINDIDADEDITLVNDQDDAEMFDVNDLHGEEVFVEKEVVDKEVSVAGEVNAASIAVAVSATITIKTDEITLAQALKSQDKGKAIMIEELVKIKKKVQLMLNEEATLKLQAEFNEKERVAREKAKKELEANITLIEEYDNIQAKIDVDYQLAQILETEEQEELTIDEKATLFKKLLKKRRKHFAPKDAEEKRNKPSRQVQQRKIICTYLKNVEGK